MAVLFADVTNSTALYQKLGDDAARQVIGVTLGALADLLPRHDGRLVKTLGDAVMCVFPDAETAVHAACEMQEVASGGRFEGQRMHLHIGLHCGPVLVEEDDVFGDTVNSAAYLTATATSEQILTTETVLDRLPDTMRAVVRPVFQTVLKGSTAESMVYQVLWRAENMDVTTVNLHAGKLLPRDTGSLSVSYRSKQVRIDQLRPNVTIGRSTDCDLVVENMFASRRHATIKLRGTRFYLIDHSTNGTFVWMRGEEVHVLRGELLLEDSGEISFGRRRDERAEDILRFERDRRSLYRI